MEPWTAGACRLAAPLPHCLCSWIASRLRFSVHRVCHVCFSSLAITRLFWTTIVRNRFFGDPHLSIRTACAGGPKLTIPGDSSLGALVLFGPCLRVGGVQRKRRFWRGCPAYRTRGNRKLADRAPNRASPCAASHDLRQPPLQTLNFSCGRAA